MYLLDTCVISEFVSVAPSRRVIDWADRIDEQSLLVSVITIGELRKGIEKLPRSKKRTRLETWLENDLLRRFEGRIASLDIETMLAWGQLCGDLEKKGMTMPAIDSLLAAIAVHGGYTLVTRNTDDFRNTGIALFNPWSD
jgi:toxin FitB